MDSGTLLKGYELRERVGSGGFGVVHRAYQSTVGREVAIKIILPQYANQPDFIRRFETEAQLVARLEHPFIVPLIDYWRDPDGAYLVMRYLRGGSLRDAIKNDGAFEPETTARVLDQVTSALALAHRQAVIHRDLKPGNILLDEDNFAYLGDFGIAKDLASSDGVTSPDAMIGSPDYLAPEQARSQPVAPQTDIYSLGVVLYEMLAGEHPFPDLTPVERMYKHLNDPLPELTNLRPEIADAVNEVIQKATAKNPTHRYDDALEFAAAFRDAAEIDRPDAGDSVVEQLTRREQEILQRIVNGMSNIEIAQELYLTVGTVKWYVRQMYKKLRVRNRVQAIVRARELNLIVSDTAIGEVPEVSKATFLPLPEPENPYKGLRAFQVADARDFFGREKITTKLLQRMGEKHDLARFLAVIGPSGSGKSSLVKAGLVPALLRGDLPGSDRWYVIDMMPGDRPLDELEVALIRIAANQSGNLHEQLQRDTHGLVRVAQLILPEDDSELVIVIDQFEEVFTLVENEAARTHFLDLVHAAVTAPRSRIRIVVTMRADFYDRPLRYPAFGELMRDRGETVLPLSAEELERAIVKPAEQVGMTFEEGLVAAIIDEALYQPGALPLLQYALTELFERRDERTLTRASYQAIGGTVGALAKRADDLYADYTDAGQEAIRQMFLRLVTLGEGTEDTRRRVPRSELIAMADDADLMDDIIDSFAGERLLAMDHDPASRTPTVEVAHEAILREWERLRAWLNDSRDDIKMQRQLAALAAEWHTNEQDASYLVRGSRLAQFQTWAEDTELALTPREQKFLEACVAERERQFAVERERQQHEAVLEKRAKWVFQVLAVILLFAALGGFGLSVVALDREQQAQNARDQAQSERDRARDLALVNGVQAAQFSGDMDTALVLALEANRAEQPSPEAQALLSDIAYRPGTMRILQTGGAIRSIAFLPDGKRIIVASSSNNYRALWDVTTGEELLRYEGEGRETWSTIAISPDGQYVLMGVGPGAFRMYEIETGQVVRRMAIENTPVYTWALAISADGTQALAGSGWFGLAENNIVLWDLSTGQKIRSYEGAPASVSTVRFDPDERTFWAVGVGGIFHFDLESGDLLENFGTNPGEHTHEQVFDIQFSVDGATFYTTSRDRTMLVWDAATRTVIERYNLSDRGEVPHVYISPDQQSLLLQEGSSKLIWLDRQSLREFASLEGHTSLALSAAISPDGRYAVSGDSDGIIRVWNLSYGAEASRIAVSVPPGRETKTDVAVSADSQYAVVARTIASSDTEDQPVVYQVIDLQTGVEIGHFEPEGQFNLDSLVLAPDGRTAYSSVSEDLVSGEFYEWDLLSGEISQQTVSTERYIITDVSETLLVLTPYSANEETPIILWDRQAWREQDRLTLTNTTLIWGDLNMDEHLLLTGTSDDEIILWDVASRQELHRFAGSGGAFDANGTIVTTDASQTITFWDAQTGQIIRQYDNIPDMSVSVTLPDGQPGLISGDTDGLGVWNQETGEIIRRYTGIMSLNSSNVNNTVIVEPWPPTTGIVTLSTWRIDSLPDLIQWTYDHRYVRDLTCTEREKYQITPYCD